MADNTSEIERLTISIKDAAALTGESEWRVKELLALGEYRAVKSGRRTLIIYESIKKRLAALPDAKFATRRKRGAANALADAEA